MTLSLLSDQYIGDAKRDALAQLDALIEDRPNELGHKPASPECVRVATMLIESGVLPVRVACYCEGGVTLEIYEGDDRYVAIDVKDDGSSRLVVVMRPRR